MRYVPAAAAIALLVTLAAYADRSTPIGQLGKNGEETGKRSNAALGQIGKRAVAAGQLVDQIDPALAADRHDIDESRVGDVLPAQFDAGCTLAPGQEAILDYLMEEGRVFRNNCEVIAWLDDNHTDEPGERDLFNVMFGPDAARRQQAEAERKQAEQEAAEERERLRMIDDAAGNMASGQ